MRNQTLDKARFEIIIVLNGCGDPWKQNIQAYIKERLEGYNIVFRQTDTPGVSNARNVGIDAAKGDFVTFIDDDDYISPTVLKDLIKVILPNTVAIFKPLAFYDEGDYFSYSRTVEFERNCKCKQVSVNRVRKVFSGPVMKLIPRNIIGNRRYDTRFKNGEDSLYMFLISDKIKGVTFAPETAIYYRRIRNNSAISNKGSYFKSAFNSFALILEYTKIYFKDPFRYSLIFYITRVMGAVKAIIYTKGPTY